MKAKPIGVIRTNGCPRSGEPKQEIPQAKLPPPAMKIGVDLATTQKRISWGLASQLQGLLAKAGRALPLMTGTQHRGIQAAALTAERMRRRQEMAISRAFGIASSQLMMRDLATYGLAAATVQMDQSRQTLEIRHLALEMWRNTKLQVSLILNPKVLECLPIKDRLRATRQIRTLNRKLMAAQGWTLEPWADPATWPPGRRLP